MSRWYYWVSGFFLLAVMGGLSFVDRMVFGSWEGKTGDPLTQTLNALIILSALALFAKGYRKRRADLPGSVIAFCALGFLFVTSLWSSDPQMTIREAVVYSPALIGAVGIARCLGADEFMDLLSWVCFVSAIGSIALLVVSPDNAISSGVDYQGVFTHKNLFGHVMVTGILAALHGLRASRKGHAVKLIMICVFFGLVIASKSAGSLLTALVVLALSGLFALWQKGGGAQLISVLLAIVLTPVFVIATASPDLVLSFVGKDPTLTGRTEIWAYSLNSISMKPLLGWGYDAYWLKTNPAAAEISAKVHWTVPHAHNGLLEMLLNVGLVGTVIYVFMYFRNLSMAITCLRGPSNALAISTIICCLALFLEGITETVLLGPGESLTTIFFVTGLMCERAVWVAKRQQHRIMPRGYSRRLAPASAMSILPGRQSAAG